MRLILTIIMQIQGGSLNGMGSAAKPLCGVLAAIGFVCYGLSIGKALVMNHEDVKGRIITYVVALAIFLTLWQLI